MDFVFTKLIFTIRLENEIRGRYALLKLKNGFMTAFRSAVCRYDGFCQSCGIRDTCSYWNTFSQSLSSDQQIIKRHQKPPLPFVFDVPLVSGEVGTGELIEIGLVVAGSAINYVDDYLNAVSLLLSSSGTVKGTIVNVESANCMGYRNVVREGQGLARLNNIATISAEDLLESSVTDFHRIVLTIDTPMRLLADGQALHDFSFSAFARSLMRRVSSMASYYYREGLEHDYKWLSSKSLEVQVPDNSIHWSGSEAGDRFAGLIGSATCEGELSDFHPFLLLGEYLHVGKSASFGMGRYRIEKLA